MVPTGTTTTPVRAPRENLDICDGSRPRRLDVKVTEDNSFPLASLIPLFPDIKRKAASSSRRRRVSPACCRSPYVRRNRRA